MNNNGIRAVTQAEIEKGLKAAGLECGDSAIVHSSLRSFGQVEGGADAVIDALLEVLGPSGNLVMPTFTWDTFHNRTSGIFDVVNTPSETGKITEVFRKRDGVLRSSHICHSVAACGPLAAEMLGDGISGIGRGSPFDALYRRNGWVLLLGVGMSSCTALHTAEEYKGVSYRYYRDFSGCQVRHADGSLKPCACTEFLRKEGFVNDFGKMDRVFAEMGILRTAKVGNAVITNVRIRELIDRTLELLGKDESFLLAKPACN